VAYSGIARTNSGGRFGSLAAFRAYRSPTKLMIITGVRTLTGVRYKPKPDSRALLGIVGGVTLVAHRLNRQAKVAVWRFIRHSSSTGKRKRPRHEEAAVTKLIDDPAYAALRRRRIQPRPARAVAKRASEAGSGSEDPGPAGDPLRKPVIPESNVAPVGNVR